MIQSIRSLAILAVSVGFFSLLIFNSCHRKQMCHAYGWSYSQPQRGGFQYEQGEELKSGIQLRGEAPSQELKWRQTLGEENFNRWNYNEQHVNNLYPAQDSISFESSTAESAVEMGPQIPDYALAYEQYNPYEENEWIQTLNETKSTFSIDVDNASYTNFRRYVNQGKLPPKDAIRVEEWLNYFNYELEAPASSDEHPLKITSEISACPWAPEDDLLMVKLQGKLPPEQKENLPPSNLVFLVDVSGSMQAWMKLDLVQSSLKKLTTQLRPQDRISIVTYAGASTIVLNPTAGNDKNQITTAIDNLKSGGGTAGSKGIETAYELAEKSFMPEGNNRVILCTDGDWNIGITDNDELKKLIEEKRETGVFLSVLGFGMGNLNDAMMEMLADNGNGNYAYVDDQKEADRLFVHEFGGTMHTIARDVKLQVEFDSEVVEEYRLLGYENRVLENWEFDDDAVDAGDLGMGQNVIAFYQIRRKPEHNGAIGKLDFRYKSVDSDVSTLLSHEFNSVSEPSSDYQFASCVIEFAMCLRESEYRGDAQMNTAIMRGKQNLGIEDDSLSYAKRIEFVGLMEKVAPKYEEYVVTKAPEIAETIAPELKMYPNPSSDFVTIEVREIQSHQWSIQLFDLNGSLKKVQHFNEVMQARVDVSDLAAGTYIVKVYGLGYNFGYLRLVVTN